MHSWLSDIIFTNFRQRNKRKFVMIPGENFLEMVISPWCLHFNGKRTLGPSPQTHDTRRESENFAQGKNPFFASEGSFYHMKVGKRNSTSTLYLRKGLFFSFLDPRKFIEGGVWVCHLCLSAVVWLGTRWRLLCIICCCVPWGWSWCQRSKHQQTHLNVYRHR